LVLYKRAISLSPTKASKELKKGIGKKNNKTNS
jgi:hypothetical protein